MLRIVSRPVGKWVGKWFPDKRSWTIIFAVSNASFIVVAITPTGPRLIQPLQYRPATHVKLWQRLKETHLRAIQSVSYATRHSIAAVTPTCTQFAHCQGMKGWVGLTRVAGYVPREFTCPKKVTHPGTNQAQKRETTLTKHNVLTTRHATISNQ